MTSLGRVFTGRRRGTRQSPLQMRSPSSHSLSPPRSARGLSLRPRLPLRGALPPLTPAEARRALPRPRSGTADARRSTRSSAPARLFARQRSGREFGDVARANPRAATFILRDLVVRDAVPLRRRARRGEGGSWRARTAHPPSSASRRWDFDAVPARGVRGRAAALLPLGRQPDEPRLAAARPTRNPANGDPRPDRRHHRGARQRLGHRDAGLGYRQPLDDSVDDAERRRRARAGHLLADIGRIRRSSATARATTRTRYEFTAPGPSPPTASSTTTTRQAQFGIGQTPLEFLQVTAAHEFFHAVQFAYDWFDDLRAHGGLGDVDGGRGLPGRHRPDQLPRPQRARTPWRPARHGRRRLRVRRHGSSGAS